jgi:beta-catenin-like protein 1
MIEDTTDSEGRFFENGITEFGEEVLNLIADAENQHTHPLLPDTVDQIWIKKWIWSLQRFARINTQLRIKHADDPSQFITSEADLDAHIKTLSILSDHTHLYENFINLGGLSEIIGLLAHDNTDIATTCLQVLAELTDVDTAADQFQIQLLIDGLLAVDIVTLLLANFKRLNDDDEFDSAGIFHGLCILDQCMSFPSACVAIGEHEDLLPWLLETVGDSSPQLKQMVSEILAVLAQHSEHARRRMVHLGAINLLLQLIAPLRNTQVVKSGDEQEYASNAFGTLISIIDLPRGKSDFLQYEGVELCLLMLRRSMTKLPAMRLLDHAAAGRDSAAICIRIVRRGGLRPIFTTLMKSTDGRILQHLLTLVASLLHSLPTGSAERTRLLAKFMENEYEKVHRLSNLKAHYTAIYNNPMPKDKSYITRPNEVQRHLTDATERIDGRGEQSYSVEMIKTIIAYVIQEDDEICMAMPDLMPLQGDTLESHGNASPLAADAQLLSNYTGNRLQ